MEEPAMRAFLSHSSRDQGLVEEVADQLGAGQVELDSTTFESGLLNVSAIQDALKRCTIFVLFLTNDATTSGYVRFEALLAQELLARGVIDRFLVVCIDQAAFSKAGDAWKQFHFVRHLSAPQSIARLIQHQLLLVRAMKNSEHHPYVERSAEKNRLIDFLNVPTRPSVVAIYTSGNVGIGRRTFTKRFYRDRYPSVNPVFAEVGVAAFDGYHELYRKFSQQLLPAFPLTNLRARIAGFLIADDNEKAVQIARIRVHHAVKVRTWVEAHEGRIALFFLPAYAPEHNPDEYLNNDLKQALKNLPRPDTQHDLVQGTASVLRSLQRRPARIRAYFHAKDVRYAA
jgi:hypothetical protein